MDFAHDNPQSASRIGTAPEPSRTFDGISSAVSRLNMINNQVEGMVDRIQPTPRDAAGAQLGVAPRQPHAIAVSDLHHQLDRLSAQLDVLKKHV